MRNKFLSSILSEWFYIQLQSWKVAFSSHLFSYNVFRNIDDASEDLDWMVEKTPQCKLDRFAHLVADTPTLQCNAMILKYNPKVMVN